MERGPGFVQWGELEKERPVIYVSDVITKAAAELHNTMTRKFIFMDGDASAKIAALWLHETPMPHREPSDAIQLPVVVVNVIRLFFCVCGEARQLITANRDSMCEKKALKSARGLESRQKKKSPSESEKLNSVDTNFLLCFDNMKRWPIFGSIWATPD